MTRLGFLGLLFTGLVLASCSTARKLPSGVDALSTQDRKLLEKYEAQIGSRIDPTVHLPLYRAIDPWMGCPYQYGGCTPKGTDCSGFTSSIYRTVYGKAIPRSSESQWKDASSVPRAQLQTGDLIFFDIAKGKKVSHVGIYLDNDRFVHASTSKGIRIDDLKADYYAKHFRSGGRY